MQIPRRTKKTTKVIEEAYEIELAGFNGENDATDHLIVWVEGKVADLEAVVDGTDATLCGPVIGFSRGDIDFSLPADIDALRERIAQADRDHKAVPLPTP